jgi:quercetin dioxygenase-like cupin family protein
MGVTMYLRVTGDETGGAYSVMEHTFPPGGGPAFLHTHPAQESVMIREGDFEFYTKGAKGKETTRAGPGDVHHVESRGPHGLKNVGTVLGRAFIVFHPADLQEKFFVEFDATFSRANVAPDPARLQSLFARHGLVLLEHPPGL